MKKLGLRVLAGGLAAMMTVSVLTPAKMARAENDLLIAPAPIAASNTLYITADMVDSDNEIIISGENWERIVVSKEAAAANIYFDAVDVGELVVESGSDSVIQLWDVDVSKVTVKEPELVQVDMKALLGLFADEKTSQQATDYFMKVQAENEKLLRSYPCIVTKEDAVVDTISAGAGIRLDLHEGDVKALTVTANDKLERMDVTLEGYNGDVTYVGNKEFNVVNLKSVDSSINKLTIADSAENNYLNISSENSDAQNVKVAGDARVALNIPMSELTIAETAKAAQVNVLNSVSNMIVAADNAKVEVAPIGAITNAVVTGNKVEIGGAGRLDAVDISGKDASVSTRGTAVKGENTYVASIYVEPSTPTKPTTTPTPSETNIFLDFSDNNVFFGPMGAAKPEIKDGALYVSGRTASWNGVQKDISKYNLAPGSTIKVSYKAKHEENDPIEINVTMTLEGQDAEGNTRTFYESVTKSGQVVPNEWKEVTGNVCIIPTTKVDDKGIEYKIIAAKTFYFEATETASFYIDDVSISLSSKTAQSPTPETPEPTAKKVELDLNTLKVQGATEDSVKHNADGSVEITYETSYQGTNIAIPAEYANLKYVEISVSSTQGGEPIVGQYGPEGNQIVLQSESGDIKTLYGGVISYIVPDDVTLASIVINPQKGEAGNPQVQTIHYIKLAAVVNLDLTKFDKGGASSVTTNNDGSITLEFGEAKYTGSNMPIPEEYKDCTYFEVSAKSVQENGSDGGTQIVFMDTAGKQLKETYAAAWSNYQGSLALSGDQTLAKIVVNNQEPNVYLTIYYVKAGY